MSFLKCRKRYSTLLLAILSFSAGILVEHYQLPPYGWYENAWMSAQSWQRQKAIREKLALSRTKEAAPPKHVTATHNPVTRYVPEKTYGDVTLINIPFTNLTRLIDMQGNTVHEWNTPYEEAFPNSDTSAEHCHDTLGDIPIVRLLPNGDLLGIYHCQVNALPGGGIFRVDKDSNLLWALPLRAHHDIHIDQAGNIWFFTAKIIENESLRLFPYPYLISMITL